ncbi:MAG: AI-2E family transporter [Erysipelotrichaceae bacterium]
MKKVKILPEHRSLAIALGTVIIVGILLNYSLGHLDQLSTNWSRFMDLLFPFIIGFSIAFLLNKPMMFFETKVMGSWRLKTSLKRTLAVLAALLCGAGVVWLFMAILLPQLVQSIGSFIDQAPEYIERFRGVVSEFALQNNLDLSQLNSLLGIENKDLFNQLTNFIQNVIPSLLMASLQITSTLFNVVLGIMAGAYMLLDKERFLAMIRKVLFALLPQAYAHYVLSVGNRANEIFNSFIVGKAIDSLIIGILCYIGMEVLQLPYAVLISVIVGVTNMIPVFGPFIGAVPGLIILTIINPLYFIYFGLFVLALQQLDGNLIGPLILGDKLGLPSLFILFAVVVGGGLFGIVGMFIGVPLFALFISIGKEYIALQTRLRETKETQSAE